MIDITLDIIDQKNERSENLQFPQEVIVFTLDSAEAECPGMLPEEKVGFIDFFSVWKMNFH